MVDTLFTIQTPGYHSGTNAQICAFTWAKTTHTPLHAAKYDMRKTVEETWANYETKKTVEETWANYETKTTQKNR